MSSDWQPIETAPKDKTRILVPYPVWNDDNKTTTPSAYVITLVYWNGRGWDNGGWMLHEEPKHWKPLPAPPPLQSWD